MPNSYNSSTYSQVAIYKDRLGRMTRRRVYRDEGQDSGTIWTYAGIARYLGICENTARVWHDKHGLPVALAPDGTRFTTMSAIDRWLAARDQAQIEQKQST